jgi:hypothetical protein
MTEMDDTRALALELYQTLENLGASPELLGVIGSWADGEDEGIVLRNLRTFNLFSKVDKRIDDLKSSLFGRHHREPKKSP